MIAIGHGEHGFRLRPIPPMYSHPWRRLPRWAKMWHRHMVLFSYEECVWRVIFDGSHNNTPERGRWPYMTRKEKRVRMFVEYVRAVRVEVEEAKLSGRTLDELAASLMAVQIQGQMFTPDMLRTAVHIKWWREVVAR
jgi:hypothetical protein